MISTDILFFFQTVLVFVLIFDQNIVVSMPWKKPEGNGFRRALCYSKSTFHNTHLRIPGKGKIKVVFIKSAHDLSQFYYTSKTFKCCMVHFKKNKLALIVVLSVCL